MCVLVVPPLLSTIIPIHGIFKVLCDFKTFFQIVPHYNTISRFIGREKRRQRERAATRQKEGRE